jgi:cytidine diphosphoramidate kinase
LASLRQHEKLFIGDKQMIIWITGLSGSGKTTLAKNLTDAIPNSVQVDGDSVRSIFGNRGYSREERLENAFCILRLCQYLESQNLIVVCSTISLFKEIHNKIEQLSESHIILLEEDMNVLKTRSDVYELKEVVGKDIDYDLPNHALRTTIETVKIKEVLRYVGL